MMGLLAIMGVVGLMLSLVKSNVVQLTNPAVPLIISGSQGAILTQSTDFLPSTATSPAWYLSGWVFLVTVNRLADVFSLVFNQSSNDIAGLFETDGVACVHERCFGGFGTVRNQWVRFGFSCGGVDNCYVHLTKWNGVSALGITTTSVFDPSSTYFKIPGLSATFLSAKVVDIKLSPDTSLLVSSLTSATPTSQCHSSCSNHCSGPLSPDYCNCAGTCGYCKGLLTTDCLSCQGNASLAAGACQCNDGYFPSPDAGNCVLCTSDCKVCASAAACGQCRDGYVLMSGSCSSCTPPCLTCSPDQSTCLSCTSGSLPVSGVCISCSATPCSTECSSPCLTCGGTDSTCLSCSPGDIVSAGSCVACSPPCSQCTSPCATCSETKESCLSCEAGYYLNVSTCQQCPVLCIACDSSACSQCADGYYPSGMSCLACSPSCLTCNPDAVTCSSCYFGYILNASNGCDSCPSNSCTACNSPCATCISTPDHCNTCNTGDILSGTTCVSCSGTPCTQCTTPCSSCSGSETNCLSCIAGYVLNEGMCEVCPDPCSICNSPCKTCQGTVSACLTCIDTMFLYSGACANCDANCNTCDLSATHCLSCVAAKYLDAGNVCQSCHPSCATCSNANTCCLSTKYWDTTNLLCTACDANCLTCSASATQCDSCSAGMYLTAGFACQACTPPCGDCLSTASTCTSCAYGYVLVGSTCTCTSPCVTCAVSVTECLSCISGTYLSGSSCLACLSPCATCTLADTTCLSCISGMYLSGSTCPACVSPCVTCAVSATGCLSCISGTYLSGSTCPACVPPCITCTSASQCIDCTSGYYFNGTLCAACLSPCSTCTSASSCGSCVNTYYLSATSCLACTAPCVTCSASGTNSCLSCPSGMALSGSTCLSCTSPCKTCSTSVTACQSCVSGYYLDPMSPACNPCHASCATCNSASPLHCSQCVSNSNLSRTYCEAYCPVNYQVTAGACTRTSTDVILLDLTLSSLVASYKDSANGYVSTPYPSATPPLLIYQRGIQLTGSQYVVLPSNPVDTRDITLPDTFSLEMWVRPTSLTGRKCLVSKQVLGTSVFSLCISSGAMEFSVRLYSDSATGVGPTDVLVQTPLGSLKVLSGWRSVPSSSWLQVVAAVYTVPSGLTYAAETTLALNGVLVVSDRSEATFFRDFNSNDGLVGFFLGAENAASPVNGFQGGIAQLRIVNGAYPPARCLCSQCTSSGLCLSPCAPLEFSLAGVCTACPASCTSGCFRSNDCVLSPDPLCAVSTDFSVCASCKPLSGMVAGACQCVANAGFSDVALACSCLTGFQPYNGVCVPCYSYFLPSEVSAKIDASFLRLIVSFSRDVDTTGLTSCGAIFSADSLSKMGVEPVCGWQSGSQIAVVLGSGYTLRTDAVSFNIPGVHGLTGTCSYQAAPLSVGVTYESDPLSPVAVLTAPQSFSKVCDSGLILSGVSSTGRFGGTLLYMWAFESDSGFVVSPVPNSYSKDTSEVKLNSGGLPEGKLKVTLYVQNQFAKTNSIERVITILSTPGMALSVGGGETVTMQTTEARRFKVDVLSTCDSSFPQLIFTWQLLDITPSSPPPSPTIRDNTLSFPSFSLRPGSVYRYQCSASSGTVTGVVVLNITATSSPLVVVCDRGGGPVLTPLVVDCSKSFDPDDLTTPPTAKWTHIATPPDTNLAYDGSQLVLRLPAGALTMGTQYTFTLTITKDRRNSQRTIPFETIASTDSVEIVNTFVQQRVPSGRAVRVTPAIRSSLSLSFSWIVIGQGASTFSSPSTLPFLTFPAYSSQEGRSFTLQLTLSPDSSLPILLRIPFLVNISPRNGVLTLTPSTGKATDLFQLNSYGWEDPDGPDLPLTLSFGTVKNGTEDMFSMPQYGPKLKTPLQPGSYDLVVVVCDSLGSCNRDARLPVIVQTLARDLLDFELISRYESLTLDQELTISACVNLLPAGRLDQPTWLYVQNKTQSYLNKFTTINDRELLAFVSCYNQLVSSMMNTTNLVNVRDSLYSALSKYAGDVSAQPFARLMGVFSKAGVSSQSESWTLGEYYTTVQRKYMAGLMPEQPAFTFAGLSYSSYIRKILSTSLSNRTDISIANVSLSIPATFLSESGLQASSVLDLYISALASPNYLSSVFSIGIDTSGQYSSLAYQPSTPTPLYIGGLTTPINVTVPVRNPTGQRLACIRYNEAKTWEPVACVVNRGNETAVEVQIQRLGTFAVIAVEYRFPSTTALPVEEQTAGCEEGYTAVIVAAAVEGVGIVLAVALVIIAKKKKEEKVLNSESMEKLEKSPKGKHNFYIPTSGPAVETDRSSIVSDQRPQFSPEYRATNPTFLSKPSLKSLSTPVKSEAAVRENTKLFTQASLFDSPLKQSRSAQNTYQRKSSQNNSFIHGHYLLSVVCARRVASLACLLAVLMSEFLVLGCLRYNSGERNDYKGFVLNEYSSSDLVDIAWAILAGTGLSLFLTCLCVYADSQEMRCKRMRLWVTIGAGILSGCAVGGVVAINGKVCEGGQWCMEFLWCAIWEVVIGEVVVAGCRYLLLKMIKRKNQS